MPKEIRSLVAFSDIDPGNNISDAAMRRITEGLEELALSIDRTGLLQPMLVQEGGASRGSGKRRLKLRVGFRRYFAIQLLREGKVEGQQSSAQSWNQVEVKLIKGNERENDAKNLVENLHRKDLDPIEEAFAMQAYMDNHGCTQAQLAREIAKSEPYVSQRLALVRSATDAVRGALLEGIINPTHAREIAGLPPAKQDAMIESLRERHANGEKIAVLDVRDEVQAAKPAKPDRKKGGRHAVAVDQEQVKAAKEAYEGKKIAPRARVQLIEGLGTLVLRDNRNSTEATTHKIQAIEWVLGLREKL